jgi:hypothetical protein
MDNTLVLNRNARKIQNSFRVYKVNKLLLKFRNLDLVALGSSIQFEEFTKVIRKKEVLKTTIDFIKLIQNYFEPLNMLGRVLLTGYLLTYYEIEILGKDDERHPIDTGILDWSKQLVVLMENHELKSIKDVERLWLFLKNYKVIFSQWQKMDKSRTIERIIISYYHRSEHIDKINDDENIDEEQRKQMLYQLEKQRRGLLQNVKMIDPSMNLQFIEKNYKKIYTDLRSNYENLVVSMGNSMKKAYYDMVKEELENGNMRPIYDLITEVSNRILTITPRKRKESLGAKLLEGLMDKLVGHNEWTDELRVHLLFMVDLIIMLGAAIDDEENLKWKKEVEKLMETEYYKNLPQILIQMEEKLDRIYHLIMKLNQDSDN